MVQQPVVEHSCRIGAAFVESTADGDYCAFCPDTNGGAFCDKLYPGQLVFSPVTNVGMPMSLTNGTVRLSGTLVGDGSTP